MSAGSSPGFMASMATRSFHGAGKLCVRMHCWRSRQYSRCTASGAFRSKYALNPSTPTPLMTSVRRSPSRNLSHVQISSTQSTGCNPAALCGFGLGLCWVLGSAPSTHFMISLTRFTAAGVASLMRAPLARHSSRTARAPLNGSRGTHVSPSHCPLMPSLYAAFTRWSPPLFAVPPFCVAARRILYNST